VRKKKKKKKGQSEEGKGRREARASHGECGRGYIPPTVQRTER